MLEKWREKIELGFISASNYDELWGEIEDICKTIASEYSSLIKKCIKEIHRVLFLLEHIGIKVIFSLPKNIDKWISDRIIEYVSSIVFTNVDEKTALEKARISARSAANSLFRDLYEVWIFLEICVSLLPFSSSFSQVRISRKGMQLKKRIPPNCWFEIKNKFVNLFLEAPRYISWNTIEEFEIARRIKGSPRPDIMIYITDEPLNDIIDSSRNPPIKPPNAIIEVKCFDRWWKKSSAKKQISKYKELCNKIIIVSRVSAPNEFEGVRVFHSIDFDSDKLAPAIRFIFGDLIGGN